MILHLRTGSSTGAWILPRDTLVQKLLLPPNTPPPIGYIYLYIHTQTTAALCRCRPATLLPSSISQQEARLHKREEKRKGPSHGGAAIVHLSRVDELLATTNGNLLRVWLVGEGLEGGLDRVHGVLGPGEPDGEVVDADGAAHFKDAGGDAESESCRKASWSVCACGCVWVRLGQAGV